MCISQTHESIYLVCEISIVKPASVINAEEAKLTEKLQFHKTPQACELVRISHEIELSVLIRLMSENRLPDQEVKREVQAFQNREILHC